MTGCKRMLVGMVGLALSMAASVAGEKLLLKNGGEYLGTPQGSEFVTCHDVRLKIGHGKLRDTSDKCGKSPIGPITGSIREVSESEFTINDSHGIEIHFTLCSGCGVPNPCDSSASCQASEQRS